MERLWHRTDEHVHRHWDISHRSGVCSLWADEAHLVMSSHQWLTITNSYKQNRAIIAKHQSPVVQNIVSLTSPLVVKMLTVLVNRISNSQVFLLKKMLVAFAIFLAKILMYMPYLMIKVSTVS